MARNLSYWNDTAPALSFPSLASEIAVDVAIVGGGIVGTTTARCSRTAASRSPWSRRAKSARR